MARDSNARRFGRLIPLALAAALLGGCARPTVLPLTPTPYARPAMPAWQASIPDALPAYDPSAPSFHPEPPRDAVLPEAPAVLSVLDRAEAIAAAGGLIKDLPAMTAQLEGVGYQVQVVPRSSQAKADGLARDWASDAVQLYVIWAYWKLPALSITRHAYYSPSKGKTLKVEFTLSSWFSKTYEEPADGFDEATLVLNEARDRHAVDVKAAHAIAKRMGYVPSKYGAAVLLDIKTYGPMWVFADMPTQTEGEPVMLVNAQTGMATQGGEALMLAKYLFQRAGY